MQSEDWAAYQQSESWHASMELCYLCRDRKQKFFTKFDLSRCWRRESDGKWICSTCWQHKIAPRKQVSCLDCKGLKSCLREKRLEWICDDCFEARKEKEWQKFVARRNLRT